MYSKYQIWGLYPFPFKKKKILCIVWHVGSKSNSNFGLFLKKKGNYCEKFGWNVALNVLNFEAKQKLQGGQVSLLHEGTLKHLNVKDICFNELSQSLSSRLNENCAANYESIQQIIFTEARLSWEVDLMLRQLSCVWRLSASVKFCMNFYPNDWNFQVSWLYLIWHTLCIATWYNV